MATYTLDTTYTAGTSANVEFPDGKTWDDVQSWYIKWDTLHIQWKDSTSYEEFELNSNTLDIVDWKRPSSTSVYPVDEETGDTNYDTELACD